MLECLFANMDGYVPVLFRGAIESKLHEREQTLFATEEWRQLGVRHPFVSYEQLEEYVSLSDNLEVSRLLSVEEKLTLDKLFRAYLSWLLEAEDRLVYQRPCYWLEPSFYPSAVYADDGDLDVYNKYDDLPIDGFARSGLYFFIAQTAKDYIRQALQETDLLAGARKALDSCRHIFDSINNIHIHRSMSRPLSDVYLKDCFRQIELQHSSDITIDEDSIWQNIYEDELRAYKMFEENMDKFRLYGLRPLLELQRDLLKRMEKDHPLILHGKKRLNPNALPPEGKYEQLAEWLESEKRNGRDFVSEAGSVTKLCNDTTFLKIIGWKDVNDNSLRTAIRRKKQ